MKKLFLVATTILSISSSYAGTPQEDPAVARLQTLFQNSEAPTTNQLNPGKVWSCDYRSAEKGNFEYLRSSLLNYCFKVEDACCGSRTTQISNAWPNSRNPAEMLHLLNPDKIEVLVGFSTGGGDSSVESVRFSKELGTLMVELSSSQFENSYPNATAQAVYDGTFSKGRYNLIAYGICK